MVVIAEESYTHKVINRGYFGHSALSVAPRFRGFVEDDKSETNVPVQ